MSNLLSIRNLSLPIAKRLEGDAVGVGCSIWEAASAVVGYAITLQCVVGRSLANTHRALRVSILFYMYPSCHLGQL